MFPKRLRFFPQTSSDCSGLLIKSTSQQEVIYAVQLGEQEKCLFEKEMDALHRCIIDSDEQKTNTVKNGVRIHCWGTEAATVCL